MAFRDPYFVVLKRVSIKKAILISQIIIVTLKYVQTSVQFLVLLGVSAFSRVSALSYMIEYRQGAHFSTQIFGENYEEFGS